jgi:hypothetical protein
MKLTLLATLALLILDATAPAFAQSSGRTCTTTCTGNANSGGKTCTKTCR